VTTATITNETAAETPRLAAMIPLLRNIRLLICSCPSILFHNRRRVKGMDWCQTSKMASFRPQSFLISTKILSDRYFKSPRPKALCQIFIGKGIGYNFNRLFMTRKGLYSVPFTARRAGRPAPP
jgi:hypothetical protein